MKTMMENCFSTQYVELDKSLIAITKEGCDKQLVYCEQTRQTRECFITEYVHYDNPLSIFSHVCGSTKSRKYLRYLSCLH